MRTIQKIASRISITKTSGVFFSTVVTVRKSGRRTAPGMAAATSAVTSPASNSGPKGCQRIESAACPCKSASTDRVNPHPGQGIPVIASIGQGHPR